MFNNVSMSEGPGPKTQFSFHHAQGTTLNKFHNQHGFGDVLTKFIISWATRLWSTMQIRGAKLEHDSRVLFGFLQNSIIVTSIRYFVSTRHILLSLSPMDVMMGRWIVQLYFFLSILDQRTIQYIMFTCCNNRWLLMYNMYIYHKLLLF